MESYEYFSLRVYYEHYYGDPDIIVLNSDYVQYTDPEFMCFIYENYVLINDTGDYLIYHNRLS